MELLSTQHTVIKNKNNKNLEKLELPSLKKVGHSFSLGNNEKLTSVNAPHLKVGHSVSVNGVPNGNALQKQFKSNRL